MHSPPGRGTGDSESAAVSARDSASVDQPALKIALADRSP